jgi:hypothetical protein
MSGTGAGLTLDFKAMAFNFSASVLRFATMLKPHFLSFLLLPVCLALAPLAARGQEVLDGIAAVVNSEVVTFSQVRELVGPKEKQAHDTLRGNELVEKIKEIRLEAINDLIDRALIIQDFKTKGFTIPDYFIDERITTVIARPSCALLPRRITRWSSFGTSSAT